MGDTRKSYALFLMLIVAMSCLTMLTIESTSAQIVQKSNNFNYLSLALPMQSISPTMVDHYLYYDTKIEGTIPPPIGTESPIITVISPKNQSIFSTNSLVLDFNTTIKPSNNLSLMVDQLSYRCSWQRDKTEIDLLSLFAKNNYIWPSTFCINLTDIPKGPHSIEIYATARGPAYNTHIETQGNYCIQYFIAYSITSTATIDFVIGNNTDVTIPTPSSTPYLPPRNPPHSDPIYYLIPISILVVIIVLAVLLYIRHRKITKSSNFVFSPTFEHSGIGMRFQSLGPMRDQS